MIGDVIHIRPEYFSTADALVDLILAAHQSKQRAFEVIAIGGESGSGKSVTAICLQLSLEKKGITSIILHQDDYFKLPPKTNHINRVKDISAVGMQEVEMAFLEKNIRDFRSKQSIINKPLVNYEEDSIGEENIPLKDTQVLIIEGTYSLSLENVDVRIFMQRNYRDTLENRIARGREAYSEFVEKVLEIEHQLISPGIEKADAIVQKDYSVKNVTL